MRIHHCSWLLLATLSSSIAVGANAADTIKIAFIDPLSGPFANVGEMEVRAYQYAIDVVNARGGVLGGTKLELVAYDSKANPQDALLALKQASDQGIRYVTQGNSSAVALAISDAIAKQNRREADHSVLFLNYAAVDPALTNDKCNFWHFRFDADADMKMFALTDAIAANKQLKKIYLLNQDYSFGQAVAKAARAMLAQKRPDIEIVGDDLHPLGKVKDFSPYIAKIRAAGADSVITGNWGNDLVLLVKAGREAGLKVDYYTYYAGSPGSLTALGDAAVGHIKNVHVYAPNPPNDKTSKYLTGYRDKYKEDYIQSQHGVVIEMLAQAIERAQSADPAKVAYALEGMTYDYLWGPVQMRADNHQLIQPLFISSVSKVDGKEIKFDQDKTGFGWKAERRIEGKDTSMATTCKMERP
jgi:branched-chain amino acid transport system substrate-binding protein